MRVDELVVVAPSCPRCRLTRKHVLSYVETGRSDFLVENVDELDFSGNPGERLVRVALNADAALLVLAVSTRVLVLRQLLLTEQSHGDGNIELFNRCSSFLFELLLENLFLSTFRRLLSFPFFCSSSACPMVAPGGIPLPPKTSPSFARIR